MRPMHASMTLILLSILYVMTRPASRVVWMDRWYKDDGPQRLVPEPALHYIKRQVMTAKTTATTRSNHNEYASVKSTRRNSASEETEKALMQQHYPTAPLLRNNGSSLRKRNNNTTNLGSTTTTTNPGDTSNNPQLYGWSPRDFPNPLVDPVRCATAYLRQEVLAKGLRLCDPDWVLGQDFMNDIALEMHNFTQLFTHHGNNWDVGIGRRRQRRLVSTSTASATTSTTMQQYESPMQQSGFQMINKMVSRLPSPRFLTGSDNNGDEDDTNSFLLPPVELAVAVVRKMNLPAVLKEGSYYTYEDEDDMVNDAAQLFARSLHEAWWKNSPSCNNNNNNSDDANNQQPSCNPEFGILIFLSIADRVCFISTGTGIAAILPWWRLEHVVSNMKPQLRVHDYGTAIWDAISDLQDMLLAGPPTLKDRLHDFLSRFGVVIGFAIFTFFFGAWGEYRDRRKRWQYAERRSQLTHDDKEKARQLQSQFHTRHCPICLEDFDDSSGTACHTTISYARTVSSSSHNSNSNTLDNHAATTTAALMGGVSEKSSLLSSAASFSSSNSTGMRRVDSFGIPLKGNDGRPVKMLRCGHIFDETCWKLWVNSGHGNPCICPVCRQDVGKRPHLVATTTATITQHASYEAVREAHLNTNRTVAAASRETDLLLGQNHQDTTTTTTTSNSSNSTPNYSSTGYFLGGETDL